MGFAFFQTPGLQWWKRFLARNEMRELPIISFGTISQSVYSGQNRMLASGKALRRKGTPWIRRFR